MTWPHPKIQPIRSRTINRISSDSLYRLDSTKLISSLPFSLLAVYLLQLITPTPLFRVFSRFFCFTRHSSLSSRIAPSSAFILARFCYFLQLPVAVLFILLTSFLSLSCSFPRFRTHVEYVKDATLVYLNIQHLRIVMRLAGKEV